MKKTLLNFNGNIYIPVMIIITLFISLGTTATTYVISQHKLANQVKFKAASFEIAEAGIEYYRWHLAHDPNDYQDGTGAPGPYVHEFKDNGGNLLGQFRLDITAPEAGSTLVDIDSSGNVTEKPNLKKVVTVKMGIPSLTNFAVAAADQMRFGEGTETFGPIHANEGIRFDGLAHNLVSSSDDIYDDPDSDDCTPAGNDWAVHTCVDPDDPSPPTAWPSRPDVFEAGREILVPSIDFDGITQDLNDMKSAANDNGIYLGPSGVQGYYIHFNNNQTVDIYQVDSQQNCQYRTCFWIWCWWTNYGNIYSIDNTSSFTYKGSSSLGLAMPINGLIFAEDDVWVDGQINGSRVTIVAAEEPLASGNANIIFNNDLLYTNYDGTDAIGLIGQKDVLAGFYSEDDLRIDAALIAQSGRVTRNYYAKQSGPFNPASCGDYANRQVLTSYGALATKLRYGFAWTGSSFDCGTHTVGSGYCERNLIYDDNFYFAPPPFFPSTGQYRIITWEEK